MPGGHLRHARWSMAGLYSPGRQGRQMPTVVRKLPAAQRPWASEDGSIRRRIVRASSTEGAAKNILGMGRMGERRSICVQEMTKIGDGMDRAWPFIRIWRPQGRLSNGLRLWSGKEISGGKRGWGASCNAGASSRDRCNQSSRFCLHGDYRDDKAMRSGNVGNAGKKGRNSWVVRGEYKREILR